MGIVDGMGSALADEDLFYLLGESKNMSKEYHEYDGRKTMGTLTARRLSEFMGEKILEEKGLKCEYPVVKYPESDPVTSRVIPINIFYMEKEQRDMYLARWTKKKTFGDVRDIIDWGYYSDRLGKIIQKMVVIPGILQGVEIYVKGVNVPQWAKNKKMEGGLR
jgi:DNA polymerase epsilon subunit 1